MEQRLAIVRTTVSMGTSGFFGTKLGFDPVSLCYGLAGPLVRAMRNPGDDFFNNYHQSSLKDNFPHEIYPDFILIIFIHDNIPFSIQGAVDGETFRHFPAILRRSALTAECRRKPARTAARQQQPPLPPLRTNPELSIDTNDHYESMIFALPIQYIVQSLALLATIHSSLARSKFARKFFPPIIWPLLLDLIPLESVGRPRRQVHSGFNQSPVAMSTPSATSSSAADKGEKTKPTTTAGTAASVEAPQFPPGSKEFADERKRKARNEARNNRRKNRRVQGPLFPHAVHVYAGENQQEFSLEGWRVACPLAKKWILTELFKGLAQGQDTTNYSVDDMKFVEVNSNFTNHITEFVCAHSHTSHIFHNKFYEYGFSPVWNPSWIYILQSLLQRPHAPGVKTSEIPPAQRFGHGIILTKHKEAADLAQEAFGAAVVITDDKGGKHKPVISIKEDDTRAVYTVLTYYLFKLVYSSTNNFTICMYNIRHTQVAVDRWAGELCTAAVEGSIWHYAVVFYKLPALGGLQVTKIIEPKNPNDAERLVLVLRMNEEWEQKLDTFPKTKDSEIPMRLGIGTFNLRKRRAGEKRGPATKAPANNNGYLSDKPADKGAGKGRGGGSKTPATDRLRKGASADAATGEDAMDSFADAV